MISLVCKLLVLVSLFIRYDAKALDKQMCNRFILKAQHIFHTSKIDASKCLAKFDDEKFDLICSNAMGNIRKCPLGPPEPRFVWFLRCLATSMLQSGFQIPVYIVGEFSAPGVRDEMQQHMTELNFQYVAFTSEISHAPVVKADNKRITAANHHQQLSVCIDKVMAMLRNAYPAARKYCIDNSYDVSAAQAAVNSGLATGSGAAVQHLSAIRHIADSSVDSVSLSNGTSPALRYALVVEGGQTLAADALRLLVELLLQSPDDAGVFLLSDDLQQQSRASGNRTGIFSPPVVSPFIASYTDRAALPSPKAYLLSQGAARSITADRQWQQLVRSATTLNGTDNVENSVKFGALFSTVISQPGVSPRHVFPPVSCSVPLSSIAKSRSVRGRAMSARGVLRLDSAQGRNRSVSAAIAARGGRAQFCEFCCDAFYKPRTIQALLDLRLEARPL